MLPDTMPVQFSATYTPIAAAGTTAQIKHLSRLLANQLTSAGLGKGAAELQIKPAVRCGYLLLIFRVFMWVGNQENLDNFTIQYLFKAGK